MSRIGKIPVSVPKEIKVALEASRVQMEGPKGKLTLTLPHGIKIEKNSDQLVVSRSTDTKQQRANHGTVRATLVNMIEGLTKGHRKDLEIQGIGLRASLKGNQVVFNLGFSHPVEFNVPTDLKISVPSLTSIIIEGADKQRVGEAAAKIRALKPVEPYKGKGIRYVGEFVRRKQGKSVVK